MAKKSIEPVCSGGPTTETAATVELDVSGVVNPMALTAPAGLVFNSTSIMSTPAERDLSILIEAQKIRRDPARFMAAKALPQAQKHYIV